MPYHTEPKNSKTRKPSKMKMNMIEKAGLHHSQKKKMMMHMSHHSMKHGEMMIKLMKKGHSFKESHMETMKKIGK